MASEATAGVVPLSSIPSLKERRRRYRQETVDAILAAARVVMQEQGVAALNLNEVARRLGVSGQALAKYFPNKATLYNALFLLGQRLFREAEEELWRTSAPDWERIRRWFEIRLALACEHPDLYSLIWGDAVPGFTSSPEEIQAMLAGARRGIEGGIGTGVNDAGITLDRGLGILIEVRHHIIAHERVNRSVLP